MVRKEVSDFVAPKGLERFAYWNKTANDRAIIENCYLSGGGFSGDPVSGKTGYLGSKCSPCTTD